MSSLMPEVKQSHATGLSNVLKCAPKHKDSVDANVQPGPGHTVIPSAMHMSHLLRPLGMTPPYDHILPFVAHIEFFFEISYTLLPKRLHQTSGANNPPLLHKCNLWEMEFRCNHCGDSDQTFPLTNLYSKSTPTASALPAGSPPRPESKVTSAVGSTANTPQGIDPTDGWEKDIGPDRWVGLLLPWMLTSKVKILVVLVDTRYKQTRSFPNLDPFHIRYLTVFD